MASESATVAILYTATVQYTDAALVELQSIVEQVMEKEPDCLGITVNQDLDDPTRFLLYETWTSREAFTGEHMRTPHLQAFMERAAEIFTGPPQVTFWRDTAAPS